MMRKISFKGDNYILIGDKDGGITTKEDYEYGRVSFAHLYPSGNVSRFGEIIGSIKDIEFGAKIEDIKLKVPVIEMLKNCLEEIDRK